MQEEFIEKSILSQSVRATSRHQLAILDPTVDDCQMLAAGVVPGTQVVILDRNRDGVEQITEILRDIPDLESLHIVSHGSPGTLYLGNSELSLGNLNRYATDLQQWKADNILLYGCNVAAGVLGSKFVGQFAQFTGAAVAASQTRVGSQQRGANWQLETVVNTTRRLLKAALAFDEPTLNAYAGAFAPTITSLDDSSYNEQDPATIVDSDITFSGGTNYQGGFIEFSLGVNYRSRKLTQSYPILLKS
ncbi:DUF4347 domain-containing protein [Oxynema sp. CENA135]|nr:DUF4347 domain-containing protein [Oxynema sp. CENA135]